MWHALKLDKCFLLNAYAVQDYKIIAIVVSKQPVNILASPIGHLPSGVYQVLVMQNEPTHIT